MRVPDAAIERLANRVVEAILAQGNVRARGPRSAIEQRVAALIKDTFTEEAAIEDEAVRIAETKVRGTSGVDQHKMIQLIKRKLAADRGFPL